MAWIESFALSVSTRDDLRTRSGAFGFREGMGPESRERSEDGADDHVPKANSESVRESGGHSLPRRSRIRKRRRIRSRLEL